jgi:hypothetical protein
MQALTSIGFWANYVVCVYAAALGLLSIIGTSIEAWLALFFLLLPIPFLLMGRGRHLKV